MGKGTADKILTAVNTSANRYTLVSLDTRLSLVHGVWCISTTQHGRCKSVAVTWIFIIQTLN